ncbi:uncharacterized protein CANTADRAFT_57432 [Suhomyces tanzawaensis NRRL Y-17324]|uniref:Uncharacterized protein n=1 Tax=Suhomyces tanzawaensis NRRL Y-17324 TaxID=984487 RepID=A0A1E4SBB6_9ASCO|nr:uncharacterized protein CANTADRAFT_57432 [Suhomyces tanzawaensis NRRL Y-17324]ODV76765.1 hypothetical protein CANTADRAFT_57432 [Suhomyces tanzawaensis NRRL Y-17324]
MESLFDIPSRAVMSPSASIESGPDWSSRSSTPIRKHRFDERSQTLISLQLKAHSVEYEDIISNVTLPAATTGDLASEILKWSETSTINRIINSLEFTSLHGLPVYMETSSLYLAVGTSSGQVVGFSYDQKIQFVLEGNDVSVSSISFTADSTFLAAGSANGEIRLWDLGSVISPTVAVPPYYTIVPITLQERFTQNAQGHLSGSPITKLTFIGNLTSKIVSVDISGLVFYHSGIKKLMKKVIITRKLLGKNDANVDDPKFIVHGCEILPIGSSNQITDDLGVLAITTENLLLIVSLLSLNNSKNINLITHFKLGKSKHVTDLDNPLINLNWYPCMAKSGGGVENAKLAYSWNNLLTVVELKNDMLPSNLTAIIDDLKDKDKGIPKIPIETTCRWVTSSKKEKIVMTKWITSTLIFVFIKKDEDSTIKLKVLYYSKEKSYDNSIKCIKQRLVVMLGETPSQIYIGKLLNWADILVGFLSQGDYSKALLTVHEFYDSKSVGRLVLIGLPEDPQVRSKLVTPYLFQIMNESVIPIFTKENTPSSYLKLYLHLISLLFQKKSQEDILGNILNEIFENYSDQSEFFSIIEPYILTNQISTLSPTILNHLVKHYIEIDKGLLLTEILCILDTRMLNIDMTIGLCTKYNLRECSIYIWNYILHDYQTPLVEFIKDFQEPAFLNQENEYLKAYSYMSLILTGRQYPIDRFIAGEDESNAKNGICQILFNTSYVNWPKGSASLLEVGNDLTIFPYLYLFLKTDSFEMLSTLNEFFEDPSLNEGIDIFGSGRLITRQYIIEALLDIYDVDEFTTLDHCQLSIFIGRNYSKYSQFIRLSESVLNQVVNSLCDNSTETNKIDCELALQSLLPYYEPYNDEFLLEKLRFAQYYNVLIDIYSSQGKFGQVLEVWLKKSDEDSIDSLANILEKSFQMTKNPLDRLTLVKVIKKNYEQLARYGLENLINLMNQYNPKLNLEVLHFTDKQLALKYLRYFFQKLEAQEIKREVIANYISLLSEFEADKVFDEVEKWLSRNDIGEIEAEIVPILQKHEQIESLALIKIAREQYEQGLRLILDFMIVNVAKLDDDKKLIQKYDKLLKRAMIICEDPGTFQDYDKELNLNEKLWLDIISSLISMASASTGGIHQFLNQCIHTCFRTISDTKLKPGDKHEDSFLRIFHRILNLEEESGENSEATTIATLANIRDILQEVFVSYSYEGEMLDISLRMLNKDISKSMSIIQAEHVKGWVPAKDCSACGKPLWGPLISAVHHEAWLRRQEHELHLAGSTRARPMPEMEGKIVLFRCGHGYHWECMGWKDMECVICSGVH